MKIFKLLLSSLVMNSLLGFDEPGPYLIGKTKAAIIDSIVPAMDTTIWKPVFNDEFNSSGNFDTSKWVFCKRSRAAWTRFLTSTPDYAFVDGNNLVLRMDNKVLAGDSAIYHSGGINTQTKFSFLYGKVEVRARFNQGQGSWPAIWMMPEKSAYGDWPKSGEIDIMEHINHESHIYQTVHNEAVTNSNGGSTAMHTAIYNVNDYNIYGLVWTANSLEFYVNEKLQYTYTKQANATSKDWPYDKPFYLILNQSGGVGWPGATTDAELPFTMDVDWIRVYQK